MTAARMSWEEAVQWLREQPGQETLVKDCYYDDPLEAAARRFAESEEWRAVCALLGPRLPGRVLDLGAGRGISTYAFAAGGSRVSALEPDPSDLVGRGAIAHLLAATGLEADVRDGSAEALPFPDASFDVVHGRAVLHHARDLDLLGREVARVLVPGGVLLATREHVLSRPEDLPLFLAAHPLHSLYGGEAAYVLPRYVAALEGAGLRIERVLGPFDDPVNYAPMPRADLRRLLRKRLSDRVGRWLGKLLIRLPRVEAREARRLSEACDVPGRHYAFLAVKP